MMSNSIFDQDFFPVHLEGYFQVWRRRWKLILIGTIASFSLTLASLKLNPPAPSNTISTETKLELHTLIFFPTTFTLEKSSIQFQTLIENNSEISHILNSVFFRSKLKEIAPDLESQYARGTVSDEALGRSEDGKPYFDLTLRVNEQSKPVDKGSWKPILRILNELYTVETVTTLPIAQELRSHILSQGRNKITLQKREELRQLEQYIQEDHRFRVKDQNQSLLVKANQPPVIPGADEPQIQKHRYRVGVLILAVVSLFASFSGMLGLSLLLDIALSTYQKTRSSRERSDIPAPATIQ